MKKSFKVISVILVVMLSASSLFAKGNKQSTAENEFAHLVGYATGKTLSDQFVQMFGEKDTKLALNSLIKGVKDFIKGKELTDDDYKRIQDNFQARVDEVGSKKTEDNLKEAEEFLEQNKTKDGILTTDSGLQYEILEQGNGELCGTNTNVIVDYRMAAKNVDNEVDKGDAITFDTNNLIPGAKEGIALMNVGSKYRFYIHPDMGYGTSGAGKIEPNALLIFDVTLKEIVKGGSTEAEVPSEK